MEMVARSAVSEWVGRNLVALDYGRRRVGVAGCRSDVPIAFGLTTLTIKDPDDLISQLEPILRERSAKEIIVGFPLTLADKPGTLIPEILALTSRLQGRGWQVHLVDEALSSRRADEILQERGRRARKGDRDRASAALILQEFLDGRLPPISEEEIRRWQAPQTSHNTP